MHIEDPLGGILDDAGMQLRDRTVFAGLNAGIAWNLAGGYRKSEDIFSDPVLATHYDTLKAAQGRGHATRQRRVDADLANAEEDAPIRARFHAWLETNIFEPHVTPAPGSVYSGSHQQTLWECWLAATLEVRRSAQAQVG
jgi:hypothetical protein